MHIRAQSNHRAFGSTYEVLNYFGISMKVMTKADMFAHKLVAMYERLGRTNRDIYDVWFFMQKHWPINKDIVEQRAKMPFKDFLSTCIVKLENLPDRNILAGMGELMDAKQKAWVKAKLKNEALFLLKVMQSNEK